MDPYHTLKHNFENIIDSLDFSILLRIVGCGSFMGKSQLGIQFGHHLILELIFVTCNYGFWKSKSCDDVVEKEICSRFTCIIKCRHRLGPFGKVIKRYNDIAMPLGRDRITCHVIYTPFHKSTYRDNNMHRCKWGLGLMIKNMP